MARPFRLTSADLAPSVSPSGSRRSCGALRAAGLAALTLCAAAAFAQPPGGGAFGAAAASGAARTARDAAPVDLTGYWVSLVTEDWIERMSPDSPPSGDGGAFGARGGGTPAASAPAANPDDRCRVYGAGGSLRVPGRLHVTWQDDDTLKIELSAGSQTRLLHFGSRPAALGAPSLQGYSAASWDLGNASRTAGFGGANRGQWADLPASATSRRWGSLDVVTTNMTGGYLLSSRANYGPQAVLTEYFTHHEDFGRPYLTVTAIVDDGGVRRTTSSTFVKEPDGSKFAKTPCDVYR